MKFYKKEGKLEVVCGSMFSGKTEELIRRVNRAVYGKKLVQVFKHGIDVRSEYNFISTHGGAKISATAVATAEMLLENVSDESDVVGIDEVQFFDNKIIVVVDHLVRQGKRVIAAGLDLDFRGIPFGPIPYLLAIADEVVKLKAVCMQTGHEAHFSQRIIGGKPASCKDPLILIGAKSYYEARSRCSFEIDVIPLKEYLAQK